MFCHHAFLNALQQLPLSRFAIAEQLELSEIGIYEWEQGYNLPTVIQLGLFCDLCKRFQVDTSKILAGLNPCDMLEPDIILNGTRETLRKNSQLLLSLASSNYYGCILTDGLAASSSEDAEERHRNIFIRLDDEEIGFLNTRKSPLAQTQSAVSVVYGEASERKEVLSLLASGLDRPVKVYSFAHETLKHDQRIDAVVKWAGDFSKLKPIPALIIDLDSNAEDSIAVLKYRLARQNKHPLVIGINLPFMNKKTVLSRVQADKAYRIEEDKVFMLE